MGKYIIRLAQVVNVLIKKSVEEDQRDRITGKREDSLG